MDADDKVDKNKYRQSKILWKTKPKPVSEKSEQNNNSIQCKVNSIEDKDNKVSSQIEAKDEKASESYYSKGDGKPITKTDVYEEVRTRFR